MAKGTQTQTHDQFLQTNPIHNRSTHLYSHTNHFVHAAFVSEHWTSVSVFSPAGTSENPLRHPSALFERKNRGDTVFDFRAENGQTVWTAKLQVPRIRQKLGGTGNYNEFCFFTFLFKSASKRKPSLKFTMLIFVTQHKTTRRKTKNLFDKKNRRVHFPLSFRD